MKTKTKKKPIPKNDSKIFFYNNNEQQQWPMIPTFEIEINEEDDHSLPKRLLQACNIFFFSLCPPPI